MVNHMFRETHSSGERLSDLRKFSPDGLSSHLYGPFSLDKTADLTSKLDCTHIIVYTVFEANCIF